MGEQPEKRDERRRRMWRVTTSWAVKVIVTAGGVATGLSHIIDFIQRW